MANNKKQKMTQYEREKIKKEERQHKAEERENRSVKRIWKTWEESRGSFMPKKTRARSMLLREYLAGS